MKEYWGYLEICQNKLEKKLKYETPFKFRHMRKQTLMPWEQVGLKALLWNIIPEKKPKAECFDEPTLTWMAEMDLVLKIEPKGAHLS